MDRLPPAVAPALPQPIFGEKKVNPQIGSTLLFSMKSRRADLNR
jgi:hypothetical protein